MLTPTAASKTGVISANVVSAPARSERQYTSARL
jgi:hypothetical protein